MTKYSTVRLFHNHGKIIFKFLNICVSLLSLQYIQVTFYLELCFKCEKSFSEQVSHSPKRRNISFRYETLSFCFHSWKLVWCLRATSLIMHLNLDKYTLWPWAVTVLQWPFSLSVRTRAHIQYSHIVIWKHHCPVLAFYFIRRMSVLLHSRHMEITFGTAWQLKAMDLHCSCAGAGASMPSFPCSCLCFHNVDT